jgi:hypothetical protein
MASEYVRALLLPLVMTEHVPQPTRPKITARGADHDHQMVLGCDAQQSKIRMQEYRVKISSSKIGNSEIRGRNSGLTRAGRR